MRRGPAALTSDGRFSYKGSPVTTRGVGLELEGISHRFGQTVAVDGVSLRIEPGEIVALLGPSGCGKTTLLRIVSGLLRQSGGHVAVDGGIVDDLPPNEMPTPEAYAAAPSAPMPLMTSRRVMPLSIELSLSVSR